MAPFHLGGLKYMPAPHVEYYYRLFFNSYINLYYIQIPLQPIVQLTALVGAGASKSRHVLAISWLHLNYEIIIERKTYVNNYTYHDDDGSWRQFDDMKIFGDRLWKSCNRINIGNQNCVWAESSKSWKLISSVLCWTFMNIYVYLRHDLVFAVLFLTDQHFIHMLPQTISLKCSNKAECDVCGLKQKRLW